MSKEIISIELTNEEYRTILESLLFSCSLDVSSKWYEEDVMITKDLAIRLRTTRPDILTENVKVVTNINSIDIMDDNHTDELLEFFPEIVEKIK